MRLRTEVHDGELHYTPKTVYHDAMVAHALLIAMDGSPAASGIKHLAEEILAEWGFGEVTDVGR